MLIDVPERDQPLGELGFSLRQELSNAASSVRNVFGGGIIGSLRASISKLGKAAVAPIVAPTVAAVKVAQAAAPVIKKAAPLIAGGVPIDRSPEKVARIVAPVIKAAAPVLKVAAAPVLAPVVAAAPVVKAAAPVVKAAVAPLVVPTVAAAKLAPEAVKVGLKPVVAPVATVARALAPEGAISKATEKVIHIAPDTAQKITAGEALVAGAVVAPGVIGAAKAAAASAAAKVAPYVAAAKLLKSDKPGSQEAAAAALTDAGLSPSEAQSAASLLAAGHDVQQVAAALRLSRGGGGGGVPVSTQSAEALLSPEEAKAQFSDWLSNYRPDYYNQIAAALPTQAPSSLGGFDAEGFDGRLGASVLDTLSQWATSIDGALQKVVPIAQDAQTIRVQLQRAQQQLPPLPTAQAQAVARSQLPAVSPSTLMIGAAVTLGAILFLRPRARRR